MLPQDGCLRRPRCFPPTTEIPPKQLRHRWKWIWRVSSSCCRAIATVAWEAGWIGSSGVAAVTPGGAGEALSLSYLRNTEDAAVPVDSSLIAAQGQDWLRRGNPGRAGDLLSAAAASESDPTRAIQRAGEAAAALVAADRTLDAAQVLADVALAKPSGNAAAAAHLQAAVLVASSDKPDRAATLEAMLRANLKQWPGGKPATSTRDWLRKILVAQQRHADAAEVATSIPLDEISENDLVSIIDAWRAAFRSAEPQAFDELAQRFQKSFEPLLESDLVRSRYRLAAALLLDRTLLFGLPTASLADPIAKLADALLEFRQRGVVSELLNSPPDTYADDASWRLMLDGRAYPQLRTSIAALLEKWNSGADVFARAERLLWTGQTDSAITMLRKLIRAKPTEAEISQQAAGLLGSDSDPRSRREAIQLWDELAAGAKQGSALWHDSKLAAIVLLQRTGNREEAARRAKYILLTMPVMDRQWQTRYQAFTQ